PVNTMEYIIYSGQIIVHFLVYLGVLNLIGQMVKLYFTYFHSRRTFFGNKSLLDFIFNGLDFPKLASGHNNHGNTGFTSSSRPSTSVRIGLYFIGQLIIDNVGNVININAPGGYIRSDQHLNLFLAE